MFHQINEAMTAYHDYLIVLSPSESVTNSIKQLKNSSARVIGEYEGHYAKAHITIQYWPRKRSVWIDPMIPKLERDLQNLSPIILDLNGFDFFDHQYNPTIYAKINSTPLTEVWFKQLRKYFSRQDFIPHITIAKSIPNKAFNKLWPYFQKLEWNEQIKIDRLTILRRDTIGHDKSYKKIKEIPFNSRYDFYTFANSKHKAPASVEKQSASPQFSLF
ncbi:2'-5' RNA ligase [Mucilaginibacter sp. OK098]|nr:2'-5' RNA ligase [Mucilaginibacter sp. OK098]